MGKTKFRTAQNFLDSVKKEKGVVLEFDDFKREIIKRIGADEERTVKPYFSLMIEFKLISAEGENVRIN